MGYKSAHIVLIIWIVSVIPFTFLGYGSDGDAWHVARTAINIYHTRTYLISRTTGFPLFELSVTPLVNAGQWYLSNLLPLVFGIMVFISLIRLVKLKEIRHPIITLITFMFLPVIIKNATSTMDYIPALSFLLWAYVFLIEQNWLKAALFIGIACGFRPTSGLFVIPAMLFFYFEKRNPVQTLLFLLVSFICGIIAYSPVLFKYGMPSPFGSIKLDQEITMLIMGYNALRLFGIFQTILIISVVSVIIFQIISTKKINSFFLFHISNIFIWIFLFLFLPDEPEYLIPIIPSIIFILDRYLSKKSFIIVAMILLSYHILQVDALGGQSGNRYVDINISPGFTIRDVQDRIFKLSIRNAANNYDAASKTLLMYGYPVIPAANDHWTLTDGLHCQINGNLCVSQRILDNEKIEQLYLEGFRLVVWKGEMWEYFRLGVPIPNYIEVIDDLSIFFGTPI